MKALHPPVTPLMDTDIVFDLRPSLAELAEDVDPEQDARVWRELALLTLGQLHQAGVTIARLQQDRRTPCWT